MSQLLTFMSIWAIQSFALSAIGFTIYQILRKFRFSARDRYLFLKIFIVLIPILPILTTIDWHLRSEFAVNSVTGTTSGIGRSLLFERLTQQSEITGWIALSLFFLYLVNLMWGLARIAYSTIELQKIRRSGQEIATSSTAEVILHSANLPPAVIGLFRPTILISEETLRSSAAPEFELILRHEEVHIRRADYAFNVLGFMLKHVLIFSPITWPLTKALEEEMELSCDEIVVSENRAYRREYGLLLVEYATRSFPDTSLVYSGLFTDPPFIKRRIQAIKENTSVKQRRNLTIALLSILVPLSCIAISAAGLEDKIKVAGPNSANDTSMCTSGACSKDFMAELTKAKKGDRDAQNSIGEMLHFGSGVTQNYDLALKWYLKSSSQGHAVAPNHIGRLYLNGEGRPRDEKEACKWYRLSAERGDPAGTQNARKCPSQ